MKTQKDYWNSVADTKEFTTPMQSAAFIRYVSMNAAILDIGCGYGRTLRELYELGYRNLTGIDFSERLIERGRHLFPFLNLEVQNENTINLPDASVDAVLLCALLTCISSDEDQEFLRNEVLRVLRPGGILYVNDFLLNTDERNKKRYEAALPKHKIYGVFELSEGAVLRHHDIRYVETFFAPFEQIEFESLTYKTMNGHTSNGYYFIGRKKSETV